MWQSVTQMHRGQALLEARYPRGVRTHGEVAPWAAHPLPPQGCAAPNGGCAGRGVRLQGPGLRTPRASGVRSPPLGGCVGGWVDRAAHP